MRSGIYKLSWSNSDYYYYGQSQNLRKRKNTHLSFLNNGSHHNCKLLAVFKKHGVPSFEILELVSVSELNNREQFYLDKSKGDPLCCNISFDAISTRGYTHKESTILKMKAKRKSQVITELTKEKIKKTLTGRKHNDAFKETNRLSHLSVGRITLNLNTGIYYSCTQEAADSIGVKVDYFRKKLNGQFKNDTSFIYA